jgi:histone deacetylase 4/5
MQRKVVPSCSIPSAFVDLTKSFSSVDYVQKELGVQKLLIVDWDIHHGNGTQHMFWSDPQVLYFSVHRFDKGSFYPPGDEGNYNHLGADRGAGYNINVPWPHGQFGDADYLAVWEHVLMPVAHEYNPDMVLISAGFDSGQCRTPYMERTHSDQPPPQQITMST